ncbi:MAG TPA: hypothetical protein VFH29_05840 [Anaerolineales bacterium]|nr:hypothetical protein [Anaerolineales bacterium]
MLISVEKRKRPNSTSNAGVTVPWIMAWTAIGIAGVAVGGAIVGISTGEGVAGASVGAIAVGDAVPVAGDSWGSGEAVASDVLVAEGANVGGALLGRVERARNSSATASPPENKARRTEPRACTI